MIQIPCSCGKVYEVPDKNAGKKLQCRRCGTVHRIKRKQKDSSEPFLVPFRVPGDSDGEGPGLAPPDSLPLDIRSPLRRCPSCGTQDEPSVVVCVRCGYDWRKGSRLKDAHDEDRRSTHKEGADDAIRELAGLSKLAWTSLSPFGIILGPYVFARSLAAERRLRAYAVGRADLQRVQQVRLTAMAGAVIWAIIAMFGAFFVGRSGGGGVSEAVECRMRLESLGRTVRAKASSQTFPADGDFPKALEALAAESELGPNALSCPQSSNLYRYGRRDEELLAARTNPDYLVLWDLEAHPDELGRYGFRALRYDGTVESFRTRAALEAARKRPGFKRGGGGEGSGTQPTPNGPSDSGAIDSDAQTQRFLAFAATYEVDDPEHLAAESIPKAAFVEQMGVPASTLLPTLQKHEDPLVRVAVALMLDRVHIAHTLKLKLANAARQERDPRMLLGAGLALRQVGDARWLPTLVEVAEEGDPAQLRVAQRVLGREAARSQAVTKRLLEQAAEVRKRTRAAGDEAIFALPAGALQHAVALLTDPRAGKEAEAVLYSADARGVEVLVPALKSPHDDVRGVALRVLDRLREKGVIEMAEFLDLLSGEQDPELKGNALKALSKAHGAPPSALAEWVLRAFRAGSAKSTLETACQRILARVGQPDADPPSMHEEGLRMLLDDLGREGDHSPVLRELGATSRILDERLDEMIGAQLQSIPDPATRERVVKLVEARVHPASLEVLLGAANDADPDVRAAALAGLRRSGAPRDPEFRREAGRVLSKRLRAEKSAKPRALLFKLVRGVTYCGKSEQRGEHRCDAALQRTLKSMSKEGDRQAMRTLVTHPDSRLISFFLDLMDANPTDPDLLVDISGSLRALTGLGLTTPRVSAWRRELDVRSRDVKARIREQAQRQHDQVATAYRKAQARLLELRKNR